jgi:hypothetical protein
MLWDNEKIYFVNKYIVLRQANKEKQYGKLKT